MESSKNEWSIAMHFGIKTKTMLSNKKWVSEEYVKYDSTFILLSTM